MRSIDEFRVLNVAAEKRNGFLPDVPTLREAGIDMVSDIRRCFAAPKGIKPAELDACGCSSRRFAKILSIWPI